MLSHLGLGSLVSISGEMAAISENPRLPECEVAELFERLYDNGYEGSFENERNDTSASCE